MVSIEQSIDLATEIMNGKNIDEDDRQDIYLMIITDFQYLKDLDIVATKSLLERTIRAYISRPVAKHDNFNDGLGFNIYKVLKSDSLTNEVRDIIDNHLYPEEKDVIQRLFGLDGVQQQSVNTIAESLHKTTKEVSELYNTSIDVIRMLISKF